MDWKRMGSIGGPRPARGPTICVALLLTATSIGFGQGPAPEPGRSPVFESLLGDWSGEGSLFGRPARFRMQWSMVAGFYRLRFENELVDSTGTVQRIITALAAYRSLGDSAVGTWLDSRPERVDLRAALEDSVVRTSWTGRTESGMTVYRLLATGSVLVIDSTVGPRTRREFARARYTRDR